MMQQLPCDTVRDLLTEFHDGELGIDDQIVVQAHLRECVACSIESAEIAELGQLMRQMATGLPSGAPPDGHVSAVMLEQVRVEERLSLRAQLRELFDDMHLVWPALGATAATIVCLVGAMGVMQAASREHPESLAGMISHLANAGPGVGGVPLSGDAAGPHGGAGLLVAGDGADAVFALAAAVTREGRIQSIEALAAEQARALGVRPEVVLAMLEAASRAQFSPAEPRGTPLAVSMVWVLSPTAGRGRLDYELLRVPTGRGLTARPPADAPAKPAAVEPRVPSPSAGTASRGLGPATA